MRKIFVGVLVGLMACPMPALAEEATNHPVGAVSTDEVRDTLVKAGVGREAEVMVTLRESVGRHGANRLRREAFLVCGRCHHRERDSSSVPEPLPGTGVVAGVQDKDCSGCCCGGGRDPNYVPQVCLVGRAWGTPTCAHPATRD